MLYRSLLLLHLSSLSLGGCGHPLRDIAEKAKKAGSQFNPNRGEEKVGDCAGTPTTHIELTGTLQTADVAVMFEASQPEANASLAIRGLAYGPEGKPVQLTIYFAALGQGSFGWHVLSTGTHERELGSGVLEFDAQGALLAADLTQELRLPGAGNTLGAPVELWFGSPLSEGGDGLDGMISSAEASEAAGFAQDGAPADSSCVD
jgi:hypothetical protein